MNSDVRLNRFVVVGSAGKKQTYMLQFIIKTELKSEIYRSTVFPMNLCLDLQYAVHFHARVHWMLCGVKTDMCC